MSQPDEVTLWRYPNGTFYAQRDIKLGVPAGHYTEYRALPAAAYLALLARVEAAEGALWRPANAADARVEMEALWQLFLAGSEVGGDPGWHGGPSLSDVDDNVGMSTPEQVEIRKAWRVAFLRAAKRRGEPK